MTSTSSPARLWGLAILSLFFAAGGAVAAIADIGSEPIATSTSTVRPNLMLILDDSGSMNSDYMPDNVQNSRLCFGFSGVNRIFFDPTETYRVPLDSTGAPLATPSWPNAKNDGYSSGSSNVNLNNAPTWSNAGSSNNTFYYVTGTESANGTSCPDGKKYTLTAVTSLPAEQQTKYLIWYSYYRKRLLMARGAVGRAMANIDATRFRVGLSAISEPSTADGTRFLNVRDFDATSPGNQKSAFFTKLYSIGAGGFTPLRPALEKIGKYYAGKNLNGSALASGRDPVQYSCQRNYTILTTDGYWNLSDESDYASNYSPKQLDGSTAIGNQDDSARNTPRPMLDDGKTQGANWVTGGAGVANTLADIAMYFYQTDLRTSTLGNCSGAVANEDVCNNNVKAVGDDTASHQHMTTFTIGMGLAGTLAYRSDYDTVDAGDFFLIKNGNKPWPNPDVTNNSSTVITRADDLWHAAVNGRGRFYSASKPTDVATGLSDVLERIRSEDGAGAAAATSTLQPVTGDNALYLGTYTTVLWEGNLAAKTIDPTSGVISDPPTWEAKNTLRAQVGASTDSRNIYFFDAPATNKLSSFTFANLSAAGKAAYFQNFCSMAPTASQCSGLTATELTTANSGTNLVNYLRGRYEYEDIVTNSSRLYRGRGTPLGDLVNAAPVFVGKPPFNYTDAGYSTFATNNAGRTKVVYVAANDGMLHAFDASNGAELWAYVPTAVMPNLFRLANFNYGTAHRYFVDGTPVVNDVYDGTNWRTILVGGLNAGGRAYYALDITNPAAPKALWEFSSSDDSDLGLTFGNPVMAKNKAGTWVVMFSSGYNNVSPGSGNGYLFVRNAITGAAIAKIPTYTSGVTPAGGTTTPSNLGKIDVWINDKTNVVAQRVYGGDMLGNVWRFDFDDNITPAGNEATLLAQTLTASGAPQPITTRPRLVTVEWGGVKHNVVVIGTGRLLGPSDVADTTLQSIYVFKDALGTGLGTLRSNAGMIAQAIQNTTVDNRNTRRSNGLNPVDWATNNGWYLDLSLASGERVNIDFLQSGSRLTVGSNIPTSTVCEPGGSSWLYKFDLTNGNLSEAYYGGDMLAGLSRVVLGGVTGQNNNNNNNNNGTAATGKDCAIVVNIRGEVTVVCDDVGPKYGTPRRTSWRELVK